MLNRLRFKAFQCNARSSTLMCRIQRNALFVLKCSDAECSEQSWMQHRWYCASWLLLTGHCALLLLLAIEGVLTTPSNMYNVSPTHHRTRFTAACTGMCCTVHLLHILSQSCASKLLKQISVKWFFPLAMMLWKYTQDDDEDDKRKWLSKPSFRQGPHFSIIRVCTVYEIIWVLLSDVISCIFHLCQSYFPREAKREMAMLSTSPPSPHSLVANPCPPLLLLLPLLPLLLLLLLPLLLLPLLLLLLLLLWLRILAPPTPVAEYRACLISSTLRSRPLKWPPVEIGAKCTFQLESWSREGR